MNKNLEELITNSRIKKEPAFECNGFKYYEFGDEGSSMSQNRFEAFGDVLAIYDAFKVSEDAMDAYMAQIAELEKVALINAKANPELTFETIQEMQRVRILLDNSRKYAAPVEKSYDMASFLYIREDENPYVYDKELNKQKKADWKNKPELLGFFLSKQLPIFLDVSRYSQLDFLNYTQQNLVDQMKSILNQQVLLNGTEPDKGNLSTIKLRAEELGKLSVLVDYLSNNITD